MSDLWYVITLFLVGFSGAVSVMFFRDGNKIGGWLNLVASSVNVAILMKHFL